jgi:D-3-phosphoglycerate dehydrogenase
MRVLVTGAALAPEARAVLTAIGAELVMMPSGISPEQITAALAGAPTHAILMRGNPKIGGAVMDAAPDLRVIAKHGAGVDSVDLAAAASRGIQVMIAGDANAPAVAEHTIGLILALGRDIAALSVRTAAGHWDRETYAGREIAGRVLGLVGFGRIARRVAVTASALGMTVIALPHHPGGVDPALAQEVASLGELLAQADIVSLHVPLTPATAGMIDAAAFAAMKPGALLINTARGALLDEAALLDALTRGHLGGAGLDTLVEEPPRPGHPLLTAPRVIVTPHIASATGASLTRMGVVAARNIAAVLTGQKLDPGNLVTPQ